MVHTKKIDHIIMEDILDIELERQKRCAINAQRLLGLGIVSRIEAVNAVTALNKSRTTYRLPREKNPDAKTVSDVAPSTRITRSAATARPSTIMTERDVVSTDGEGITQHPKKTGIQWCSEIGWMISR